MKIRVHIAMAALDNCIQNQARHLHTHFPFVSMPVDLAVSLIISFSDASLPVPVKIRCLFPLCHFSNVTKFIYLCCNVTFCLMHNRLIK
jgi:hypothetical protein